MPEININNKNFIEQKVFKEEVAGGKYPEINYRLRLGGVTEFNPSFSEYPQLEDEKDADFRSRQLTSGRFFGEQEILIDDVLHSSTDIQNLKIDSTYLDGQIPRTLLYLEKATLINDGKEYLVHSQNLNNLNLVSQTTPRVIFPIDDLHDAEKGRYLYKKDSAVNHNGKESSVWDSRESKITKVQTDWTQVGDKQINSNIKASLEDVDLSNATVAYGVKDINYHPYSNQLYTEYKVVNSAEIDEPKIEYVLDKARTVNFIGDPSKSYTLERRVTRESDQVLERDPKWEEVSSSASFPYTDTEKLTDGVTGGVDFEISGVYETQETAGIYSSPVMKEDDYFEVDIIKDWGKSKQIHKDYTFREDTQELIFGGGERLKLIQKGNVQEYMLDLRSDNQEIVAGLDLFFSPYGTGQNASISGSDNEQNHYQLEYQLIPALRESRSLLYEEVPSDTTVDVGDLVFLNTGSVGGEFEPIDSNLHGGTFSYIEERRTTEQTRVGSLEEEQELGPSYQSGFTETIIEPEEVSANESSGNGYSYFVSGEKFLVTPRGGYNGPEQPFTIFSAGESRATYFENLRRDLNYQADPTNVHRLVEARYFDFDQDEYVYGKEREVRIKETAICKGDSASELSDQAVNHQRNYLLDSLYNTRKEIKRNGSILNIDSLDGSVSWGNQKSNQEEFERKLNLFFEKNYVASLAILATGQEQNIEYLSQFMEDDKVYYLERDVYIDSDVRTQANGDAPVFFSSERGSEMNPFSVSAETRNPSAVGDEKLYVTQVYHKQKIRGDSVGGDFPFGDYSYYNSQPTVKEEFVYSNHISSIVDDFEVINNTDENIYSPGSYSCEIKGITQFDSENNPTYDGFSLLGYQGVSLTGVSGSATYDKIAFNSLSDGKLNVSFTPLDTGVYYEVQGRETAKDSWTTLSHAVESYKGVDSINLALNHDTVIGAAIPSTFQMRALEWRKSPITSNPNNITSRNESPDSLILASNGTDGAAGSSNNMYDESKSEHAIVANETIDLVLDNATWPNEEDNSNIYYLDFDADDNSNYVSVKNHRSLNLQKGDFSFEFWLKGASFTSGKDNNIISKGADYKIVLADGVAGPTIQFNTKVDGTMPDEPLLTSEEIVSSDWVHVAICGVFDKNSSTLICKLFIDGQLSDVMDGTGKNDPVVSYASLVPGQANDSDLKIGGGLDAKLYQARIYIGKSNYRSAFTVPSAEFSKEAFPLRYKALRYKFRRRVSPLSNWIINRNQFNNSNPPEQYKNNPQPQDTYHSYEWLRSTSTSTELDSPSTRARLNYITNYAYRAPNNPHINKNYEGTPITNKDFGDFGPSGTSGSGGAAGNPLAEIVTDNYSFIDRDERRISGKPVKSPYYFEYIGDSTIQDVRREHKGGLPCREMDLNETGSAYTKASRLKITKYVYRLYTKRAVVLGDTGYPSSRSAQGGWTYQLQYKAYSNGSWSTDWTDNDAIQFYSNSYIFYRDEYGDATLETFNNINTVNDLPMVVMKSDLTEKYKPDNIKFRITKKQNLEIGSAQGHSDSNVYKKINSLPYEVNVPISGCLNNLARAGKFEHSHVTVGNLDPETTYIIQRASDETILTGYHADADELKASTLSQEYNTINTDGDRVSLMKSTEEDLPADKPISVKGLTGIMISGSSYTSVGQIDSYVGLKPSGIEVQRFENRRGTTGIAETFPVSVNENKIFISPSITGSQIDELNDFLESERPSNCVFSGISYITGQNDTTSTQPIPNISFDTVHKFHNSPISTSSFDVDYGDAGKTFVCSGASAAPNIHDYKRIGPAYSFDVVNISDNVIDIGSTLSLAARRAVQVNVDEIGALSLGTPSGTHTPVPNVDLQDGALFLASGLDKVTTSNESSNFRVVNIGTGQTTLVNANSTAGSDGNAGVEYLKAKTFSSSKTYVNGSEIDVVTIEPGKVYITPDDTSTSETIVVDSHSEIILPSGSANNEYVTVLNATDDELRVVPESGFLIEEKNVHYLPKKAAQKFLCTVKNPSEDKSYAKKWTASDIEVLKFNQLPVTSSHFDSSKVFIHNEDVDVRITSGGVSTGKYISVARSQINEDVNLEFLDGEKVSIMRVFIDDSLHYVSPTGVLGVRIEKTASGWEIKDIPLISFQQLLINNASHGSVYFNKSGDDVTLKFDSSENLWSDNFEFLLIVGEGQSFKIHLESTKSNFSFLINEQEGTSISVGSPSSVSEVIKITKRNKAGKSLDADTFMVKSFSGKPESIYEFSNPGDTKDRIIVNRGDDLNVRLPDTLKDFSLVVANFHPQYRVNINRHPNNMSPDDDDKVALIVGGGETVRYRPNNENDNFVSRSEDFYGSSVVADTPDDIYLSLPYVDESSQGTVRELAGGKDYKPASYFTALNNTGDDFRVPNHGLVTKQKIHFNCENMVEADLYYSNSTNDINDIITAGKITPFGNMAEGDTLLLYDSAGVKGYYYVTLGALDGGNRKFDRTSPLTEGKTFANISSNFQYNEEDLTKGGQIFACIKKSTKISGTVASVDGIVYNLDTPGTEKTEAQVIALNSSKGRSADLYVKVINSNVVRLYSDATLSTQVAPNTTAFSFMSDTFWAEPVSYSKINFVNTSNVFNINDQENGVQKATMSANQSTEIRVHDGLFTTSDLAYSGVHLATGYNDAVAFSSTSIGGIAENKSLDTDTVFLSGQFRAKGTLNDASFDDSFYINAGLDKVEINNADQSNSSRELDKDRAYKLNSNNVNFDKQDAMGTTTADIIYYPKNEIHIPNRKSLGILRDTVPSSPSIGSNVGNFVFYKPKKHNEDLKIVLPSSFSNLGEVKVVNLHDREVEVVSFADPTGVKFTLKPLEVATFTEANDFSYPSKVSVSSIYNTGAEEGLEINNVLHETLAYDYKIGEFGIILDHSSTPDLENNYQEFVNVIRAGFYNYRLDEEKILEKFHILQEGDIVIEHDIHNTKTLVADGPVRFRLPYFASRDGSASYVSSGKYNSKAAGGADEKTTFKFINISRDFSATSTTVSDEAARLNGSNTMGAVDYAEILSARNVVGGGHGESFVPMVTYTAELLHFGKDGGSFDRNPKLWEGGSAEFVHFTPDETAQELIKHAEATLNYTEGDKKEESIAGTGGGFVFGKQISLDLHVYLDKSIQGDVDSINYKHGTNIESKDFYKIVGIGGRDVTDLKIINTSYESVKINSVTAVDIGANSISDVSKLEALLLSYFNERGNYNYNLWRIYPNGSVPVVGEHGSSWFSDPWQSNGYYNRKNFEIPINLFEGKDKTFSISLGDIVTKDLNLNTYSCLFELDNENDVSLEIEFNDEETDELLSKTITASDLIKTREYSATRFKTRSTVLPADEAGDEDWFTQNYSHNITADIVLPLRSKLDAENPEQASFVDFLIINGSRRSVTISSPERGQLSVSLAASGAKKIRYTNGAFTDITADVTNGVVVLTVTSAVLSTESGMYIAQNRNDSATATSFSNSIKKIKIINVTGEPFYVKNSDASKTFAGGSAGASHAIAAESYSNFIAEASNFVVSDENNDIALRKLEQEARVLDITKEVYENEIVLFYVDQFDTINFLGGEFFATTFVPVFSHGGKKSPGDALRIETILGQVFDYKNEVSTAKSRANPNPCSISAAGVASDITVHCHLFEFIMGSSFNNKIIFTKKRYDYVLENDQNLACHLYQDLDDAVNVIGLNSSGDNFLRSDNKIKSFGGGITTGNKIPLKIAQTGSVSSSLTITKKQIYLDILRDGSEITEGGEDIYFNNRLYNHFYLSKSYYSNKVVVLNSLVDIICTASRTNGVLVNNSGYRCSLFGNKSMAYEAVSTKIATYHTNPRPRFIEKNKWVAQINNDDLVTSELAQEGVYPATVYDVKEPRNEISDAALVTVINRPSHINAANISGLKLLNISNKTLRVNSSSKIYSAERADYTTLTDASYSECVKSSKQDWFVALKGLDYPFFIRDPDYFNPEEHDLEFRLGKKGQINVDYIGARYKFSNIFRYDGSFFDATGLIHDTSIGTLDSAYKYGMTLFGDKKGDQREISFNVDLKGEPVDWDILSGLKVGWDMPERVMAYSMNTGHERLIKCKHFDERTGLITLEGIRPNKYYKLDDFDETNYDFVGSMYGEEVNAGEPTPSVTGSFQPSVYYNGTYYPAGTRFKGVIGVTDYKIKYQYFATLKVSQFDAEGLDDSDSDLEDALKEDKKILLQSQSKFDSQKQWTKVGSSVRRQDFITGRVTKKIAKESGYEDLTKDKKIEDFEKEYKEITNVHEKNPYKGQKYVDIIIPRKNDFDYLSTSSGTNNPWVLAGSNERLLDSDQDLYLVEVRDKYLKFRIRFDDNGIVAPGYEYKIKGSVKYDKNANIASGKSLLNISLSEKDAVPFLAHGKISTLNEDFATPGGEEFVAQNMKGLQEKYEQSSGEDRQKTQNAMYALQSLSENESFFTLKNSQGYAFIPFSVAGGVGDPLYGLRLNIRRDRAPYQSIRFRLKKLTDRRLIFEDIKKDSDIGSFFNSDRKLKYILNTDVTAMSYHDILRPGGVAKLTHGWNTVTSAEVSAGTLSSSVPVVDGDCIIFKKTENNIIARKPYPVRVSVSSDVYTLTPLIVYTPADITGVTTKLAFTVNNGQAYKIVNYFNLEASNLAADKNTHRAVAPMKVGRLNAFYGTDDDGASPISTVKHPIVVGSKRFYIEEGAVFDPSSNSQESPVASIGSSVRVNLELSSIAKHWLSERTEWRKTVEASLSGESDTRAPHWNQKVDDNGNMDVFSNFRNILYRGELSDEYIGPVQIELVTQNGNTFNVNIKLSTNADYRYIYKSHNEIKKIEINGGEISGNTAGVIELTSPDILIQVETASRDTGKLDRTFDKVIKKLIYENFLLVESAECVDQVEPVHVSPYEEGPLAYFDYQIPKLSTDSSIYGGFSDSEPLIRPYDSYFTENYDWLTAYGHKQDNLVKPKEFQGYGQGDMKAGLLYDGGMPASVKYIYPEVVDSKGRTISSELTAGNIKVRFFINKEYWDGFKDRFGREDVLFRTRPETIECDLQKLNGSNWEDVSWASGKKKRVSFYRKDIKYDWQVSSAALEIGSGGSYNPSASYRLKVTKVKVNHGKKGNSFENKALRFPFSLSRTTIFDSDITTDSIENGSKGIYEHRVSLIENPIMKNSPALPAEGLTKLGKYEFKKIVGEGKDAITLPCTRLYMFRLKHSLRMVYQDKIRKNGIGRVSITSFGKDYKVPPTVDITKPSNASKDDFTEASARAIVESGKLTFIEVVDSGSGYFDVKSLLEKDDSDPEKITYLSGLVKNSKRSVTPVVQHSFVIQGSFDESCDITEDESYVTHGGNISIAIAGAKVTGTGIPSDTKILSVDSSIRFTLSKNATQSGTVTLTFYSTEPELAFIKEGSTVKTTAVTLSGGGGPIEKPESFGLSYSDTEAIARSQKKDLDVTSSRVDVNLMEGSSEDDETWGLVRNQAARVQRIKDAAAGLIKDSSDNSSHGIFTEDEYSGPRGKENEHLAGLYEEGELDTIDEPVETIETSDGGGHDIVISTTTPTQGAAIAIINDRSPANYRIIDNEIANKATPHFSSFSREDNPAMPKSFGIVPAASLNAEVFNTFARAINNMHSIAVEAPIYAKVRRYRQYEYRYIENMGGLEFESDPKSADYTEVEDVVIGELDYTEFDNKSQVNFFTFIDRESGETRRAYFSAFANNNSTKDNIVNVEGEAEEDRVLYDFNEDGFGPANINAQGVEKFNEKNKDYTPRDIGLPSQINIGKSNGVVCPPRQPLGEVHNGEEGMELPKFSSSEKRRAFAYSGKNVFTSETYDITDEDWDLADKSFVDIRGSEYIWSSSRNDIIFGCFFQGKPFLSTFLKTTRVWTEYEIIVSPEFADTLPVGVRDKYRPDETKLRANLITQRTTCSNEKFSTVNKSRGYHSLCNGGSPINGIYDSTVSYESLFGLREGDSIIGPVETDSETSQGVVFAGKGVLKVEPEFNLALAVYASHRSREYRVANSYNTSSLHTFGPCIHKCSPMVKEILQVSDDPLLFDLRK